MKSITTTLWLLVIVAASFTTASDREAAACDPAVCNTVDCHCSSTDTPGGITDLESVPQFVVLSFDDGITVTNTPFYEELTQNYANPNGCQITMTFFVCHANTDYTLVNRLHQLGHEIATHSVTLKPDIEHYWRNMTPEMWRDEIMSMRTMLDLYGNISPDEVKGFRVPFLEVGGNEMYEALQESGFSYDSSWPTLLYTPWYTPDPQTIDPLGALWPYTLDYMSIQEETVGTKPTESIPGIWVSPMTDMQDNRNVPCPMLDLCQSANGELETSAEAVFDLLKRNFRSHYFSKRSPFGIYARQSWFAEGNSTDAHQGGFKQFLDYLSGFPDVYVVSVNQLIEWTKDPHTLADLGDFEPLQCSDLPISNCDEQVECVYTEDLPIDQAEVYMKICGNTCPLFYPWVSTPYGNTSSIGL